MKNRLPGLVLSLVLPLMGFCQVGDFSKNPEDSQLHTEDIINFWKVFDLTYPKLNGAAFQEQYIDVGSEGLHGFMEYRIESGKKLAATVKNESDYYKAIRQTSLSIIKRKQRFYECFVNMKQIYPNAVFPDLYFVIGRKNAGGTTFKKGLIIGAEMFGVETEHFKPRLNIDYLDEVVAHELVHFQQNYIVDNSLLAQCIREGSADFICELIAGDHTNKEAHLFGEMHHEELWSEFVKQKNSDNWKGWLYSNDNSRPKDLGYWMGYKITKAYYEKTGDKAKAIQNILNIENFESFLAASGYDGK